MTNTGEQRRFVVGCMTGTSLDGLDAALVEIVGRGLTMEARYVDMIAAPLGELADRLGTLASGEAHRPLDYMRAARELGCLHAAAVGELIGRHDVAIDFVVAHGQTIWHAPSDTLSWQLLDPWPIVRSLGLPVCYDLRQADLIAGGQGAPITPIADPILYRDKAQLVFNLGGICNYTAWSGDEIKGGDVTVCNILLDGLVRRLVPGKRFDTGGELALSGKPREDLVALISVAIAGAGARGTTLGREQFAAAFLDSVAKKCSGVSPGDALASAIEAVVIKTDEVVAAAAVPRGIVVAGGGARNRALVEAMKRQDTGGNDWHVSDDLSIPCEAREAVLFAVLGALSEDGVPTTLPEITGSENPGVAGVWAGK